MTIPELYTMALIIHCSSLWWWSDYPDLVADCGRSSSLVRMNVIWKKGSNEGAKMDTCTENR